MSLLRDKILAMKPKEYVVLKTKPTQGLEKKPSANDIAAQNRLLEQAGMIKKSKQFSAPTEVFMVSSDGRVELTKMNAEGADILKSYGLTFVPAGGLSMLTFKLAQQYGGEKVFLNQMLKCSEFKAAYSAAK